MATLEDLEARVAVLEADRAVLAAINASGANQREQAEILREHGSRLASVETKLDATHSCVRSLEEGQAEIKDLLVRALDRS